MAARPQFLNAAACLLVMVAGGAWLFERHEPPLSNPTSETSSSTAAAADRIDTAIESQWSPDIRPAPVADDLQIARRLALTLHGRIPALDEIRWFESRPATTRLDDWVERLLNDRCFSDYFAERFARALVHSKGSDNFPFPYRRALFAAWLAGEFAKNRPYDELAREMLTADGLWTNKPATNFVTAHEADPIRLTTRTMRGFLGLRIDCAQCHNHPFADWQQEDFNGLAAYFGDTGLERFGIGIYEVDRPLLPTEANPTPVVPHVPFSADLVPHEGPLRQRLACWITHPDNPYFAKALANRLWALMFGAGLVEKVDDLDGPQQLPGVLDALADEVKRSGYDLRYLIRLIAKTDAFRRSSAFHGDYAAELEPLHAAFPVTRLRSEQLARAMLQTTMLTRNDFNNSAYYQIFERRLIEELGDKLEEEMEPRHASLSQRLSLLNSDTLGEPIEALWSGSAGVLTLLRPAPEMCVEIAFLVVLSRRPDAEEVRLFADRFEQTGLSSRQAQFEDLLWTLTNGTEFGWLH